MHGFCTRRDMHLWWRECLPDCEEDTSQSHLTGKPSAGPRGHTAAAQPGVGAPAAVQRSGLADVPGGKR